MKFILFRYSIFSSLALCAMHSAICPPPAFATSYAKYRAVYFFTSIKKGDPHATYKISSTMQDIILQDFPEILDRLFQSVLNIDLGFPAKPFSCKGYIRSAPSGIIQWQRIKGYL
jgi:hypothetical protein